MDRDSTPPTESNPAWDVNARTGRKWNDPDELAYWRTRPASERLEQAAAYRVQAHGLVTIPMVWKWRLVHPDEE